ncbi:phospholipase A and acyltransferase 3-like [Rhinoraja longicauda]
MAGLENMEGASTMLDPDPTRACFQSALKPKPGDLIEIPRNVYTHWAIYIGGGEVIHLTSDGASGDVSVQFSSSTECAEVKREPLTKVAGTDPYYVNNSSDTRFKAITVDKIINRAKESVGRKVNYSPLKQNCEHFVNSLRYGKDVSYQADGANLVIDFGVIATAVSIVGVIFHFLSNLRRY